MPKDKCGFTTEEELEEDWFGRLSTRRKAELDTHLAGCEACRSLREKVRGEIAWLRTDLTRWEAAHVERRREARHPVKGEAYLALGSGRQPRIVAVRLRDECPGGLGVWSPERCRAGQHVTLEREGRPLQGIIRYCRRAGELYRVGIQFQAA
jgi:anti-sigma factor RsiW